jgi:hypothetical protein
VQAVDLTSMVLVGDTYEILPQHTLVSLFVATGGSFLTGTGPEAPTTSTFTSPRACSLQPFFYHRGASCVPD